MAAIKSNVPHADQLAEQLRQLALKGQYKKGVDLSLKILKKYPDDFFFKYQYAKLLGDWADDLPLDRRKKLKANAAKILKPLTRKLSGQPLRVRFGVCLNYYYQSYEFLSMYKYGQRLMARDKKLAFYAKALGASLLAEEKYFSNLQPQAKKWAVKSVELWKKYNVKGEPYYFPFYCLAQSWVILGDPKLALANLKMAAKVSKRDVQCAEFRIVFDSIQRLNLKK